MLTQKKRQDAPKVYALSRAGGRVHRQGEGAQALRVRRESQPRHDRCAVKGGQFILHAKALPGNPYDGHTLKTVLPGIEAMTGAALSRILADAGYKGHNPTSPI